VRILRWLAVLGRSWLGGCCWLSAGLILVSWRGPTNCGADGRRRPISRRCRCRCRDGRHVARLLRGSEPISACFSVSYFRPRLFNGDVCLPRLRAPGGLCYRNAPSRVVPHPFAILEDKCSFMLDIVIIQRAVRIPFPFRRLGRHLES
jgi:hypothetical protein